MSEEQYPNGSLPAKEKLLASVVKLFKEIGATNLTRRVLVKRLGAEYKINFEPHKKDLDAIVLEVMQMPENAKEVAKASKAAAAKEAKPKKESKKKKEKESKDKDGKDKKQKRVRSEGEPKRAQAGFFFFGEHHRAAVSAEVREANGGKLDVTQVSKKMGALWAAASPEEKAKFEAMAAKDKERYADELKKFEAAGGVKGGVPSKKSTKEKDADAPKRPMNASFDYTNSNREAYKAANPGASMTDIVKALSEKYKNLSEAEKQPWIDKAQKAKEKYEAEMAARKQK